MAKRLIILTLFLSLGVAHGTARAQALPLPDPSRLLGDLQYNAFGKRLTTADLQFNAFGDDPPVDQSLHGAIKGGLRDAAFLGPRLLIDAEYLMMFIQPANAPPLLTTGSLVDPVPGALGQPNTIILYSGEIDYGPQSAGRIRATWSIIDQFEILGSFYLSEQKGDIVDANSDAAGNPLLARPFFDPTTNQQNADPRAVTNSQQGFTHTALTSQVLGTEMLVRWSEAQRTDGPVWSIFGGFNYVRYDERLYISDFTRDLPLGTGSDFTFTDDFSTSNRLYAGLVGAQLDWCFPDGVVTLFGKMSVGGVQQKLSIRGSTVETTGGITQIDGDQGLYAQPTNVGDYAQWKVGLLPEFGINFGYNIHSRVRLSAGYTFMYFVNVIRPDDQIDTTVNVQPLFSPVVTSPFRPTVADLNTTNVWIQYLNFGLRFVF